MSTKEERVEQRRQWREQEARDIEASKAKMASEYGLERDHKFDIAWDISWSRGHSSGINEVENYFGELVDLLVP